MCSRIKTLDAQSHKCIVAVKQNTRKGKSEGCTMYHLSDLAKGIRMIPSQVSLQLPSIPNDAFMSWISVIHMLELEGSGKTSRISKLRLQELREFEMLSTTANPVTARSFVKPQMSAPVQSLTKCFDKVFQQSRPRELRDTLFPQILGELFHL